MTSSKKRFEKPCVTQFYVFNFQAKKDHLKRSVLAKKVIM